MSFRNLKSVPPGTLAIEIAPEKTVLRDLGSTNGTYVTGQRVDFAYLQDRAEFDLGNTRIRYLEISK
jgi:pSer/pThr/pTyr-binding forkhead associated (FHA) protein